MSTSAVGGAGSSSDEPRFNESGKIVWEGRQISVFPKGQRVFDPEIMLDALSLFRKLITHSKTKHLLGRIKKDEKCGPPFFLSIDKDGVPHFLGKKVTDVGDTFKKDLNALLEKAKKARDFSDKLYDELIKSAGYTPTEVIAAIERILSGKKHGTADHEITLLSRLMERDNRHLLEALNELKDRLGRTKGVKGERTFFERMVGKNAAKKSAEAEERIRKLLGESLSKKMTTVSTPFADVTQTYVSSSSPKDKTPITIAAIHLTKKEDVEEGASGATSETGQGDERVALRSDHTANKGALVQLLRCSVGKPPRAVRELPMQPSTMGMELGSPPPLPPQPPRTIPRTSRFTPETPHHITFIDNPSPVGEKKPVEQLRETLRACDELRLTSQKRGPADDSEVFCPPIVSVASFSEPSIEKDIRQRMSQLAALRMIDFATHPRAARSQYLEPTLGSPFSEPPPPPPPPSPSPSTDFPSPSDSPLPPPPPTLTATRHLQEVPPEEAGLSVGVKKAIADARFRFHTALLKEFHGRVRTDCSQWFQEDWAFAKGDYLKLQKSEFFKNYLTELEDIFRNEGQATGDESQKRLARAFLVQLTGGLEKDRTLDAVDQEIYRNLLTEKLGISSSKQSSGGFEGTGVAVALQEAQALFRSRSVDSEGVHLVEEPHPDRASRTDESIRHLPARNPGITEFEPTDEESGDEFRCYFQAALSKHSVSYQQGTLGYSGAAPVSERRLPRELQSPSVQKYSGGAPAIYGSGQEVSGTTSVSLPIDTQIIDSVYEELKKISAFERPPGKKCPVREILHISPKSMFITQIEPDWKGLTREETAALSARIDQLEHNPANAITRTFLKQVLESYGYQTSVSPVPVQEDISPEMHREVLASEAMSEARTTPGSIMTGAVSSTPSPLSATGALLTPEPSQEASTERKSAAQSTVFQVHTLGGVGSIREEAACIATTETSRQSLEKRKENLEMQLLRLTLGGAVDLPKGKTLDDIRNEIEFCQKALGELDRRFPAGRPSEAVDWLHTEYFRSELRERAAAQGADFNKVCDAAMVTTPVNMRFHSLAGNPSEGVLRVGVCTDYRLGHLSLKDLKAMSHNEECFRENVTALVQQYQSSKKSKEKRAIGYTLSKIAPDVLAVLQKDHSPQDLSVALEGLNDEALEKTIHEREFVLEQQTLLLLN